MSLGCLLLGLGCLWLFGRRETRLERQRREGERLAFERRRDALRHAGEQGDRDLPESLRAAGIESAGHFGGRCRHQPVWYILCHLAVCA